MTEPNEYVEAAAKEISALPVQGQREFVRALVSYLGGQDEIIMELIEAMLSKAQKYHHITRWMGKRFEKDMTLSPKRVAEECVYYLRVNSKMMPLLIKTGQRVKDRIRHRRSYATHK
ncbi:MAG: hypothetical protein ABSC55_24205 [Syntrophorhabdales bacterium]|jgi:hypothetical protein